MKARKADIKYDDIIKRDNWLKYLETGKHRQTNALDSDELTGLLDWATKTRPNKNWNLDDHISNYRDSLETTTL